MHCGWIGTPLASTSSSKFRKLAVPSKADKRRLQQARRAAARNAELANAPMLPPGAIVGATQLSMSQSYSGPIPPPKLLEDYNHVQPGTAKMILDLWEKQVNHRMDLEQTVIKSDIRRSWAGLFAGFLIAVGTIGTGGYLVHSGHDTAGGTIATVGLGSLVGTFIYGTRSQRTERIRKAQIMTGSKGSRTR